MSKPVIDAKQALKDLRSGMSDSALMAKYNLSVRGLESLLRKLIDAGVLREIRASQLIRDIRSGMGNRDLMRKYDLNQTALKRLFAQITDSGMSVFSGNLGSREKKVINMGAIVEDIRSGLTETQLMAKYDLSSRGLQSAFWKLVQANALTWEELLSIYPALDDSVTLRRARQWDRNYPLLEIRIYDLHNPVNKGRVKDISEAGIGAVGLRASVGETKTLVLVPQSFMNLKEFCLDGECRWVVEEEREIDRLAGFEITDIDEANLKQLREVVGLMTLTFD
jgi:uncharacterized protein (DUF433 family)